MRKFRKRFAKDYMKLDVTNFRSVGQKDGSKRHTERTGDVIENMQRLVN